MIYKAKELLAHLNNLTLSGIDDGRLEWIGTDEQWWQMQVDSLSTNEIKGLDSDDYDLKTCHKQ